MSILQQPKVTELQDRLRAFMRDVIAPGEREYWEQHDSAAGRWSVPPAMD